MGGAAKKATRAVTRSTGGGLSTKTLPHNQLVRAVLGDKAADQLAAIEDPADLFGGRAAEEMKKQREAQERAREERKREIEELFAGAPQNIKATDAVKAQQIAGKLAGDVNLARGDIDFLRKFSQAKGPSDQANYLLQSQQLEQSGLLEDLSNEQARQQAQQFSSLAQQGGLGAGSRERLAAAGQSNALREAQKARREGSLARLGILSQDEGRKLNVASNLPGQQTALTAERRQGLQADQDANLRANMATQQARLKENLANFGNQQNLFNQRAAILGGQQASKAQQQAAKNAQGGPLGQGTGVLGLDFSFLK